MDQRERQRAIDLTLANLEKQFGRGSILRLGSRNVIPVTVISSGSISVDAALGVGGFPRGRVVEIFGPESSGKTTLALQVVAEAQKAGGAAAFIDAEHALDPVYARKLGVDTDNLLVSQPDYGEQALEITGALVASGAIDVVVIDSVAALVPKAELEGEMGDSHMGLQARLMSQALRKLAGTVSRTNTCLIFINQLREKIGVMFGNPGDYHWRARAEVLRFDSRGRPAHRFHQGRRRGGGQPHQSADREEQGGGAVPRGGVRSDPRRGHLAGGRPAGPGRVAMGWWRRAGRGSATGASASGRGARRPGSSSKSTSRRASGWMRNCASCWDSQPRRPPARARRRGRPPPRRTERPNPRFLGLRRQATQRNARKLGFPRTFLFTSGVRFLMIDLTRSRSERGTAMFPGSASGESGLREFNSGGF